MENDLVTVRKTTTTSSPPSSFNPRRKILGNHNKESVALPLRVTKKLFVDSAISCHISSFRTVLYKKCALKVLLKIKYKESMAAI